MQETRVSIQADDRSSIIAAFFLGIAAALFIVIYWLAFPNILAFSFVSLATLVIFLTIAILLANPRTSRRIVRISKLQEPKKEIEEKQPSIKITTKSSKVKPLRKPLRKARK